MPAMAKAGANYMNSQLIKMEAIVNGYAEGIALDDRADVSEGSGENIFLVHDGKVAHAAALFRNPPRHHARQRHRDLPGNEYSRLSRRGFSAPRSTSRTSCSSPGTAAEITPIRTVDRIPVGEGRRGPITERIQKAFFEITSGERGAPGEWLMFVNEYKPAAPDKSASDKSAASAGGNGHNAAHAREVGAAASSSKADAAREAIHVTLTE